MGGDGLFPGAPVGHTSIHGGEIAAFGYFAAVVVVFSFNLICKIKLTTVLTTVGITNTKGTAFLTMESTKGDGLSHLQV